MRRLEIKEKSNRKALIKDAVYRPAPFWFLNHHLRSRETRWQIEKMVEQGLGGAVLHSRHGRKTPYLSEEWFRQLEVAIKEGRKYGMIFWLYDEDNWPSGPAGGKILREHPEYKMSYLYIKKEQNIEPGKTITWQLASNWRVVLASPLDEKDNLIEFPDKILDISRKVDKDGILLWTVPEHAYKWRIFEFATANLSPRMAFYDYGYLDVLNPEAVRKFIDVTHRQYVEHYKGYLGNTIRGFFTDEPAAFHGNPEKDVTFTPRLFEEFLKMKGYDLKRCLPALFMQLGERGENTRIDYYDVLRKLYQSAFYKQIYTYCEKHNLQLIGHMLFEGQMQKNARYQMDFFDMTEYMHQAGVDFLGNTLGNKNIGNLGGPNNLVGPKIASSSAHLLGKRVTMSEAFGEIGWDYDLSTLKRLFDWQLALGVNYIIPHAFYYSIQGFRKGECPPDEFWRIPFSNYYHKLSSYIANACREFTDGRHTPEVAVLYPNRSLWAHTLPQGDIKAEEIEKTLDNISRKLVQWQYDFDYISEKLLVEGSFSSGKLAAGPKGKEELFSVVILPNCYYLMESTKKKLKEFASLGGNVILVNCKESLAKELNHGPGMHIVNILEESLLRKILPEPCLIIEPPQAREDFIVYTYLKNQSRLFFIYHTSEVKKRISIKIKEKGRFNLRNLETDELYEIKAEEKGEYSQVDVEFTPWEVRLIEVRKTKSAKAIKQSCISSAEYKNKTQIIDFHNEWKIEAMNDNALILKDWKIDFEVRRNRPGGWMRNFQTYTTAFQVSKVPSRAHLIIDGLVHEKAVGRVDKDVRIHLNDKQLTDFNPSDVIDHYMWKTDISKSLRKGTNKIKVICGKRFYEAASLTDPMIIMGDFTVVDDVIETSRNTLQIGDWTKQGFPYFAGTITYIQEIEIPPFEYAWIKFPKVNHVVEVNINRQYIDTLAWSPWRVEITEALEEGRNLITLKITNNLANLIALQSVPGGLIESPQIELVGR